jgi:hypothetical protein
VTGPFYLYFQENLLKDGMNLRKRRKSTGNEARCSSFLIRPLEFSISICCRRKSIQLINTGKCCLYAVVVASTVETCCLLLSPIINMYNRECCSWFAHTLLSRKADREVLDSNPGPGFSIRSKEFLSFISCSRRTVNITYSRLQLFLHICLFIHHSYQI